MLSTFLWGGFRVYKGDILLLLTPVWIRRSLPSPFWKKKIVSPLGVLLRETKKKPME